MKIKVCGITELEQMKELDEAGVDFAGMIFYSHSPRYILNKLVSTKVRELKTKLLKVGVFVNASEEDIMTQIELYGLDLVQLHGEETPAFCNHISNHVKVIRAFRLNNKNGQNIDWMIKPYEEVCDHYLFDTYANDGFGGSGMQFNWEILKENKINKPFFLSGGIGLEDAQKVLEFEHPFLFGVDVNSKFETAPGVKEMGKVREFVSVLRKGGEKC